MIRIDNASVLAVGAWVAVTVVAVIGAVCERALKARAAG